LMFKCKVVNIFQVVSYKFPPGVNFFHSEVRRRKYKLGQTKQILLPKSRFV
jgi:hypothetical protein